VNGAVVFVEFFAGVIVLKGAANGDACAIGMRAAEVGPFDRLRARTFGGLRARAFDRLRQRIRD
jgi:hypothetical protein